MIFSNGIRAPQSNLFTIHWYIINTTRIILMSELLQLLDIKIISNDNRVNLHFPLTVLLNCFLPAAIPGDES